MFHFTYILVDSKLVLKWRYIFITFKQMSLKLVLKKKRCLSIYESIGWVSLAHNNTTLQKSTPQTTSISSKILESNRKSKHTIKMT